MCKNYKSSQLGKEGNTLATSEETKQAIRDAVWSRQIDQMSTREIAEQYSVSLASARTILMSIRNGTSGDARFKPDIERGGVIVEDGSTFDYSPMDIDGNGISDKAVKHYIWFCS